VTAGLVGPFPRGIVRGLRRRGARGSGGDDERYTSLDATLEGCEGERTDYDESLKQQQVLSH
jgi:hypothetical protein